MSSTSLENYVNDSDDFCLLGMVGIIDPPREGIYDVIKTCRGRYSSSYSSFNGH